MFPRIGLLYGLSALRLIIIASVVFFAVASALWLVGEGRGRWNELQLDPLPEVTKDYEITVTGRVDPSRGARIRVNENEPYDLEIRWTGRFETDVYLARQVNELEIEYDDREPPLQRTIRRLEPPQLKPEIRNILKLSDGHAVVVGLADAEAHVRIIRNDPSGPETPAYGSVWAGTDADDYGVFTLPVDSSVLSDAGNYSLEIDRQGKRIRVPVDESIREANTGTIVRTFRLDLTQENPRFDFEVSTPNGFPNVDKLLAGDMGPRGFIRSVFGNFPLEFRENPVEWTARTTSNDAINVKLGVSLDQDLWRRNRFKISTRFLGGLDEMGRESSLTEQDSFTLVWAEVSPSWFSPLPNVLDSGKAVWNGPLNTIEFGLPESESFRGPQRSSEKKSADDPQPLRKYLSESRFPGPWNVFATTVLLLLPFGWFLYALHRHEDFSRLPDPAPLNSRQRIVTVVVLLGVLSLYYPAYRLFSACGAYLAQATYVLTYSSSFAVMWLAALTTLPLVAKYLTERSPDWNLSFQTGEDAPKPLRPVVARTMVFLALLLLGWWFTRTDLGASVADALAPLWRYREFEVAALIPVFFLVLTFAGFGVFLSYGLIWLTAHLGSVDFELARLLDDYRNNLAELLGGIWPADASARDHTGYIFIVLGVLVFIGSLQPIRRLWAPKTLGASAWRRFLGAALILIGLVAWEADRWASWVGAVFIAWAYIWLCFYLAESLGSAPPTANRAWHKLGRLVAYLLAVIFCFPAEGTNVDFWRVGYLLNHFNYLGKYLLIVTILAWLYNERNRSPDSERTLGQWLGPGLFAFFLMGSAAYVLYIPIPLILGYILARHWLFRPAGNVSGTERLTIEDRKSAIQELIDQRWLNNMRRLFRKAQDKKLQKGEVSLSDHQKANQEFDEAAETPAGVKRMQTALTAMADGPHESAWTNGLTAVKYSLPLALVPVFLGVFRYASQTWHTPYPVPGFILELAIGICYWLLIAFFFGYFYRRLRGNSGLGKGVNLAIAIAVPYLCLRLLLLETPQEMGAFFIWAGQIFAYCTILGLLAFDYETLRLCGFSWQQLTAIHRTQTLSAFGSSLLAALGPLIFAVYQGQAKEVVNFALSFLGALFPEAAPPESG